MPIVKIPNAGQFGVVYDLPAYELPVNAWSRASNVRFKDGCVERFRGDAQVFDAPSVTPYYVAPYQVGDYRYWVHAGLSAVYADDGTTRTDITGTAPTGSATDFWNGGTLNGVFVLNNGKDQPMFWGGNPANNLATLTGWNANWRAKVVRPFKNYLVALDVTKSGTRFGNMVKWSHSAVPGTIPTSWDETDVTKDAGEQDLAEEPSAMVDCLPLGDVNIIYKERAMFAMQYIGHPAIFRFQRLPGDVGALAQRCAVATPIGHVVLTPGDVVVHNGQGPQSIANAQVRRWLFTSIDSANYRNAFLTANPARNEVWVCFPEVGSTFCSAALVFNWLDKTWAYRQLSNVTHGEAGQLLYSAATSWDSDTGTWDEADDAWGQDDFSPVDSRLILASTAPRLALADSGMTFSGSAFTSLVERTGLTFDAPQSVKTIRAVYPRIDASDGTLIRVEVGGSMDAETAPTWSPAVEFTVGQSQKIDAFVSGRFLAVRFTSLDNKPWRIKSYDLDIVMRGAF